MSLDGGLMDDDVALLAKRRARGLIAVVSPTSDIMKAFVNMVDKMEAEGESNEAITLALLSGMVDGMRHGNWPTAPAP